VPIRKIIDDRQTTPEALLHDRHFMAYKTTLERVPAGAKMVEIGHGPGYGLDLLASKVEIVGLDIDPSIVEYARKTYPQRRFELYDGSRIPFDDRTFDAACMFQVIEHVKDDVGMLTEVRRVLKEGGMLFLTTPNQVLRVPYGERPWNEEHVREYYPEELTEVMTRAGFSKVEMLGIDASDEYRKLELQRVARSRRLRRLDPLGLRRLLPDQILYKLGRAIVGAGKAKGERTPPGEFFVTSTDLYRSLDLLGIGHR
jgi:ubiquinone/menaquinone biosynthesis C-methylase UbiE